MDDSIRYTPEQVLRGIQAYVDEQFGVHLPLNPDVSVSAYHDILCKQVGCPLDFLCGLGDYFGLRWDERRWAVWLRLPRAKHLRTLSKGEQERQWNDWLERTSQPRTIRSLAQYIARHAKGSSMAPVTVFGNQCAPAGAFLGICQLPELRGKQVAPSTRIRQVLGGAAVKAMLRRARWISGTTIRIRKGFSLWSDPLPYWSIPLVLLAFPGIPMLLGVLAAHLPIPPMVAICVAVVISFTLFWKLSDRLCNPLPDGVVTFGDLARMVATNR